MFHSRQFYSGPRIPSRKNGTSWQDSDLFQCGQREYSSSEDFRNKRGKIQQKSASKLDSDRLDPHVEPLA